MIPYPNLTLFHIINGLAGGIAVLVGGVIVQRKYKSRKLLDPDFKNKDILQQNKK